MRIGLSGGANFGRIADQVAAADSDGFSSMWFAGAIGADPLVVIPIAARESQSQNLEFGTSIVQTYPCHPVLMAQRASAVAGAIGPGRFTLGVGVSHQPVIQGTYGLSYERPGVHMREYLSILGPLLRGEPADVKGEFFHVQVNPGRAVENPIPILVAALGTVMLRSAGELADGTILWMTNAKAIETHVAPKIGKAAAGAGRPQPRIVAGLPVAVCDEAEGREAAAQQFGGYGALPNYRRILDIGGVEGAADAAIVGDEKKVASDLQGLIDAGATDVWAAIFPVGEDRNASRERTRDLLKTLV